MKWGGLKSDCLTCHKDFHRFGTATSQKLGKLGECLTCHNETNWKEIHGFNHSVDTRYPIDGKHIGVQCTICHIGKIKDPNAPVPLGRYHWEKLPTDTCATCHRNPHINETNPAFKQKKCDECHSTEGWNVFEKDGKRFDHDKTRFKLTGRHGEIACSACHVVNKKQVFKFPSFDQEFCIDCHKNQHIGQFHKEFSSKKCSECHNTIKFTDRFEFDHDKTAFKLYNKHSKLKCSECHKPTNALFETRPPHRKSQYLFPDLKAKDCTQCHSDYHEGQLSQQCSTCHNDSGWKNVAFDHNKQSKFPIIGKHIDVKCAKCHKPIPKNTVTFLGKQYPLIRYRPISTECTSCHKDPHRGRFGHRCQECHMEKGWKLTKDFHRGFTLTGVHYSLQCQECHRDNRRLAGSSDHCVLCHQKDDIHQGSLPECGQCHKQQFWENTDFKHSLTAFPLRGIHRTLECSACHANGIYQGLSSECVDCHLADAQTSTFHPNPLPSFRDCKQCHNRFDFSTPTNSR